MPVKSPFGGRRTGDLRRILHRRVAFCCFLLGSGRIVGLRRRACFLCQQRETPSAFGGGVGSFHLRPGQRAMLCPDGKGCLCALLGPVGSGRDGLCRPRRGNAGKAGGHGLYRRLPQGRAIGETVSFFRRSAGGTKTSGKRRPSSRSGGAFRRIVPRTLRSFGLFRSGKNRKRPFFF